MQGKFSIYKKITAVLLITILIFGASIFIKKQRAEASLPVIDPTLIGTTFASWLKQETLDALRDAIVKRLVDMMTDSVVDWIQGGGEPGFVQDWGKLAEDAFSAGVGDVVSQSNLKFLCSPFKLQMQAMFLQVPRFQQQISCTLDQIVGNIDAFYEDFSQGGWIAYDTMWLPQNNFYGAFMMTSDEALNRAINNKMATTEEAAASRGYLSTKKCAQYSLEGHDSCMDQCLGDGGDKSSCESKCTKASCIQYKTVTPGDLVGEMVSKQFGAQSDWIVNVKSVVSAIVNATINRLISEGLSLMDSSTNSSISYNDIAPPEYQSVSDAQFNSQKQSMLDTYNKMLSDRQILLDIKNQSLDYARSTLSILNSIKFGGCFVTDAEISIAQSEVYRLDGEVLILNQTIAQLQVNIDQLNELDSGDSSGLYLAANTYQNFLSNNPTLQTEIYTGEEIKDAKNERTVKVTENQNVQVRLNSCSISI